MKRVIFYGLAFVTASLAFAAGVVIWPIGVSPAPIRLKGDVNNGAYLARASGCIACHTNTAGGGAALAGGVKFDTPFGALYSPNLTTDPDHGIGKWTIEQFATAVRQGVSPSGHPYYPAFTYPFYSNFTDQDIANLWAAFRTVPPVEIPSPEQDMSFPFNQRWGLKLWRAAFLEAPLTGPEASKGEVWNRGKLLVEGAAHCAACHTGRNLVGARKTKTEHFKGSNPLPGGGKAPAIDVATLRSKGWTVDSLAFALRTGITPEGDAFGGAMGEVVLYGTGFLTDDDRAAMADYLMDGQADGKN